MHNPVSPVVRRAARVSLLLAVLAVLAVAWVRPAEVSGQSGITLQALKNAQTNQPFLFDLPTFVTSANDNTGRLFVLEKGGKIWIIQNGQRLATPFLDISSRVGTLVEGGMLGIAFPANFAQSGYFFVYYTHVDVNLVPAPVGEANEGNDTVIARFRVTPGGNVADPNSEERIYVRNQPFKNHKGGMIAFGKDGYLYIGLGDGGSRDDPYNSAQRLDTTLGKILRIQVGATGAYSIPPTNPFANNANAETRLIWDYGLRNPWRWSFDRTTGDMLIGDVGQDAWEEINIHPAGTGGGLNFGWRCFEGTVAYIQTQPCTGPFTSPILTYGHGEGVSVTGGYVYRGTAYPSLQGKYLFGDFGSGIIWSSTRSGNAWTPKQVEIDTAYGLSSFGEDQAGELYVLDYYSGQIFRVQGSGTPPTNTPTNTPIPPTATNTPIPPTATNTPIPPTPTNTPTLENTPAPGTPTWTPTATPTVTPTPTNTPLPTSTPLPTATSAATSTPTATATSTPTGLPSPTPTLVVDKDFQLPGTQPGGLTDTIANPATCQTCHTDPIYKGWRGSMMGQAGRDPLFWAAFHVAEDDVPGSGDYCLRCHTPKGWFEGRSHPSDGSVLTSQDIQAGVACEVCHRMVSPYPTASSTDQAAQRDQMIRALLAQVPPTDHIGSAMIILDPQDNRRGPFAFAEPPPHPLATWRTDLLGQNTNPVVESTVCGSCHTLDNPALSWDPVRNQYWPNAEDTPPPSVAKDMLFPIERTFDEWKASSYATAAGVYAPQFAGARPDGIVRTCQDCHMPRATGTAVFENGVERDCKTTGCLPVHELVGGNTWVPQLLKNPLWRLNAIGDTAALDATTLNARAMLQRAASLSVLLSTSGNEKIATVFVVNQSGHKLPTGYAEGRRMWLTIQAYDANDKLVYASGVYDPATGVLAEDPALKVYEVKQGITPELAAVLGKQPGESFHFVLNNTTIKDNRIPPRGYTVAAYNRPGMVPIGATYADGQYWDKTTYNLPTSAVRVKATLYYQTASKEYIDFLRTKGGQDGIDLGRMWDESKSPPEAIASVESVEPLLYFPSVSK